MDIPLELEKRCMSVELFVLLAQFPWVSCTTAHFSVIEEGWHFFRCSPSASRVRMIYSVTHVTHHIYVHVHWHLYVSMFMHDPYISICVYRILNIWERRNLIHFCCHCCRTSCMSLRILNTIPCMLTFHSERPIAYLYESWLSKHLESEGLCMILRLFML